MQSTTTEEVRTMSRPSVTLPPALQAHYDEGFALGMRHGATDPRARGEEPNFDDDAFYWPLEAERDAAGGRALYSRERGAFVFGYEDGYATAIGDRA